MSKTGTVIIGCKMPNGIIMEFGRVGSSGYRKIVLKGANQGRILESGLHLPETIGGFGRTEISAADWEAWSTGASIPGNGPSVVNERQSRKEFVAEFQDKGYLFMVDSVDAALAQANEKAGNKTGFERMDPKAKIKGAEEIGADAEQLAARQRENFGAVTA